MNISNKKLKKALEHYQSGDYESALKICEKFLEKDYSNEEALFLEGDILYKLGRIDDAIVTWKINSEYNKNEEATNRLAAVDKERKAQALSYTNIQNMSSEDRILLENAYRENIELKRQVDGSELLKDTKDEIVSIEPEKTQNSELEINNVGFAPIDNDVPKEYGVINTNIDDILKSESNKKQITHQFEEIDIEDLKDRMKHLEDDTSNISEDADVSPKEDLTDIVSTQTNNELNHSNNIEANEVSPIVKDEHIEPVDPIKTQTIKDEPKTNIDNQEISMSSFTRNETTNSSTSTSSKKKIIIPIIAVVAVIVVAVSYSKISSNKTTQAPPKVETNQTPETTIKPEVKPQPDTTQKPTAVKMLTDAQAKQFESDANYLISADSIDGVNTLLINNPKDTIPQSAMPAYDKALSFMQTQGLTYYYDNGMSSYNNKNYIDAISYFTKAKPYVKSDFRGPTMLFLTGASYGKLGEDAQALQTYKDFLVEYPDSENYTPEALYHLAVYYSDHGDKTLAKQYASEISTKFSSSMYNNDTIKSILK